MSETNQNTPVPTVVAPVGVKLLDTKQAAQVLGVSWRTVQNLLASGQLQSITVGRLRRIPVEAIEEFVRSGAAVIQSPEDDLHDFLRDLHLGTARVHGKESLHEILSAHQREIERRNSGDPGTDRYFERLRLVLAMLFVYSEQHVRRLHARKAAGVKATRDERKATRLLTAACADFVKAIEDWKSRQKDEA